MHAAAESNRDRSDPWSLGAIAVMLTAALVKATIVIEPFPHWSQDPTLVPAPTTALGPAATLGINALILLAATLVIARAESLRPRWVGPLAAAGVVPVAVHALVGGVSISDAHVGLSWVASVYAAVAVWAVAHQTRARALTLAVVLGAVAMLAAKGALQVLVEHPATVASFRANRELFLAANGWSPGSPMALAFERRLLQREATAWFGLANVLVTLAAFAADAGVGLSVHAWRRRAGTLAIIGSSALALCGLGLVVAGGSKGGYAAAAIGLATLAFVDLARAGAARVPALAPFAVRIARWLPSLLAAALLAVITLRGLLGERLGELSLLFRWFYAQAAARILAAGHWPLGVGPDGFKDAYLLHKNPLSPEEVTSPHNVLLDWVAALGLGGAAWAGLWVAAVVALGLPLARAVTATPNAALGPSPADTRPDLRVAFLVFSIVTIAGVWTEAAAATPEASLARAAGLLAATLIAAAILRILGRSDLAAIPADSLDSAPAPLAAAGIPLALLGLIDMAPIAVGSSSWTLIALAAVAAPGTPNAHRETIGKGFAVLGGVAGLVTVILAASTILPWERRLARAAHEVLPLASLRARAIEYPALAATPIGPALARELDADARALLGVGSGLGHDGRADALLARIGDALPAALERAWTILDEARAAAPLHGPTAEAASRVAAQRAQSAMQSTMQAPLHASTPGHAHAVVWMRRSIDAAREGTRTRRGRAAAHLWLATVLENAEPLVPGSSDHVAPAVRTAAEHDPFNAHTAARLARTLKAAPRSPTDAAEAVAWARRALDLNADLRLDPIRQLSAQTVSELRAIVQEAGSRGTGLPGDG